MQARACVHILPSAMALLLAASGQQPGKAASSPGMSGSNLAPTCPLLFFGGDGIGLTRKCLLVQQFATLAGRLRGLAGLENIHIIHLRNDVRHLAPDIKTLSCTANYLPDSHICPNEHTIEPAFISQATRSEV